MTSWWSNAQANRGEDPEQAVSDLFSGSRCFHTCESAQTEVVAINPMLHHQIVVSARQVKARNPGHLAQDLAVTMAVFRKCKCHQEQDQPHGVSPIGSHKWWPFDPRKCATT